MINQFVLLGLLKLLLNIVSDFFFSDWQLPHPHSVSFHVSLFSKVLCIIHFPFSLAVLSKMSLSDCGGTCVCMYVYMYKIMNICIPKNKRLDTNFFTSFWYDFIFH